MPHKLFLTVTLAFIVLSICLSGCDEDSEEPLTLGLHTEVEGTFLASRTGERYFQVYGEEGWADLIVKGVNIGTSLPGRWYTEFPADRTLYRSWLEDVAALNANTVRIYTLLDPAFYAVLAEYNAEPGNSPIYLFQEIWPDDAVPGLNFYDDEYVLEYKEEIKLVIDALHGNADIPSRPFRAYGNYSADVSPYLAGIMIGRELEPEEVEATNLANPAIVAHDGDFVKTAPGAVTPTEVWLAEMSDYVLQYSESHYNWQYPVGFVSWPTLDPLTHPTEWDEDGKPGYNDREEVDPNIFLSGPLNKAGFFGAYHIYPNYPDFMNNEPGFAAYSDAEGTFRYKGYLHEFMAIHPPYPALVAEFGISTSLNTAHFNPEGLHHGGLSEVDLGEMTVRMMRSIIDEGYAGGIIFEWSDEWAKKTWNTEPFMVPWERQVLWQNAMCPEQKYGLVSVEPEQRSEEELWQTWHEAQESKVVSPPEGKNEDFGRIEKIEVGADEAFFYMALTIGSGNEQAVFSREILESALGVSVAINTGFYAGGEFILPFDNLPELPAGAIFILNIKSAEEAELLAIPSYNRGKLTFNPQQSRGEDGFTRIETIVNRERTTADGRFFPALYSDESVLNYGYFDPDHPAYFSGAHWHINDEDGKLIFRLPWMLLNVSDPSAGELLAHTWDSPNPPARDELNTVKTKGFLLYALTYNKKTETAEFAETPFPVIDFAPRDGDRFDRTIEPYLWPLWEEPRYQFRLKEGFDIIANYFATLQ